MRSPWARIGRRPERRAAGRRARSAGGSAGTACRRRSTVRRALRRACLAAALLLSPAAFGLCAPSGRIAAPRAGRDRGRRRISPARRRASRPTGAWRTGPANPSRGLSTHISITAEVAPSQLAAVLDLAQRRDHGVGILGQLDRARVGEELALARQREADHHREEPGDRDQRDRDHDRNAARRPCRDRCRRDERPQPPRE